MRPIEHCIYFLLTLGSFTSYVGASKYNFNATFGPSPAPFTIDVYPEFIKQTKLKASLTRMTQDLQHQREWTEGPPRHNVTEVRDYWLGGFDWFEVQRELNQKYTQFTTTVSVGSKTNYTLPVPLHFVHHTSDRADAIPLLFIHGWPGSFLEVGNIIDGLTNPPNESVPAFHVVAPSIPGFGFSPPPIQPGFDMHAAGEAFNNLMLQLGYAKYVIQGGDFGGVILRFQARDHPDSVVSLHSNFWVVAPNKTDYERLHAGQTTEDETYYMHALEVFDDQYSGFRLIQQKRPLQLAIAMTDSPVGLAMWLYDVMHSAVESKVWTPKEVLTWTMMYWVLGPYGSFHFYVEAQKDGGFHKCGFGNGYPYVHQPVAIAEFPYDVWYKEPLDWAQRYGNVVRRTVYDRGSHFAAVETPDLLLNDIWSYFRDKELSGTGVFYK